MASLDTRGKEAVYLRTLIEGLGCKVILTDISMRKHDQAGAAYTCADVASMGEASFEQISSHKGTSEIITPMVKGCVKIARKLFETGSIDAIAGFGGASNTLFVSSVMGSLPFGLPKLILSSSAAIPAYAAGILPSKILPYSTRVSTSMDSTRLSRTKCATLPQ